MDSSICVAVTTGLPAALHFLIMQLLREEDLLQWDLHAEVAARDHDAVASPGCRRSCTRPSWFSTLEMIGWPYPRAEDLP